MDVLEGAVPVEVQAEVSVLIHGQAVVVDEAFDLNVKSS